jgi:radical SAM protein with 4Fe4S-binding SPASM domain
MTNISITLKCNRQCSYCFAGQAASLVDTSYPHMSFKTFKKCLHFLARSNIDQVRLLGGEPTLHPDFNIFVDEVLNRGLRLLIFTNGLIPEPVLRRLEETPVDSVGILINAAAPTEFDLDTEEKQKQVFCRLGLRVSLGLNIHSPMVQLDFLLDLVKKYQLSRFIRLGLAHPCLHGSNKYLHPRHYDGIGHRILDFIQRSNKEKLKVNLDCGFVPCMFAGADADSWEQIADVFECRCNPILDILPDGRVVSCYSLADFHCEPLPEDKNAAWLRERFMKKLMPYAGFGIFRECAQCPLPGQGYCSGGCVSTSLLRLRQSSFRIKAIQDYQ